MKAGDKFGALANCHAPGIFSIPLEQTNDYIVRMFIDTLGNAHHVAAHNHRYALHLEVIHGEMQHSVWRPDDKGPLEMYEYRWHSPIRVGNSKFGEGRFEQLSAFPSRWNVQTTKLWWNGALDVSLAAHEVHSLVTDPGTCWIVTEGLDETDDTTTLAFVPNYRPNLKGLYIPIGD